MIDLSGFAVLPITSVLKVGDYYIDLTSPASASQVRPLEDYQLNHPVAWLQRGMGGNAGHFVFLRPVPPKHQEPAKVLQGEGHKRLSVVIPSDRQGQVRLRHLLTTAMGVLDGLLVGAADVRLSAPLALHVESGD